jgi:hypothetical protein
VCIYNFGSVILQKVNQRARGYSGTSQKVGQTADTYTAREKYLEDGRLGRDCAGRNRDMVFPL